MNNKITIEMLPDWKKTQNGNPRQNQSLTSGNVAKVCELLGWKVRFNMMLHAVELHGEGLTQTPLSQERAIAALEDVLTMLDIPVGRLHDTLGVLARHDRYHTMQDWITSAEWDGTDYIAALAETVPTETELWPVYLRKWLIQAVEAVRGWEDGLARSLPHVLVFTGQQGANKGRWLRTLGANRFTLADAELHLNSNQSKDHLLHALQYPIIELGEIDSTFRKSDVSSLKSFLSRQDDAIRSPYARCAVHRPRMSVFCGSVNSREFLNDPTGTRRFWPVELAGALTWDHGIDMQQVWAQADVLWCANEDWNLNEEQEAAREEDSHTFVQQAAAVDMLEAYYEENADNFGRYAVLNKTEIARACGAGTHPGDLAAITGWMETHVGAPRRLRGKYRSWAFPVSNVAEALLDRCNILSETDAKRYARWNKGRKK